MIIYGQTIISITIDINTDCKITETPHSKRSEKQACICFVLEFAYILNFKLQIIPSKSTPHQSNEFHRKIVTFVFTPLWPANKKHFAHQNLTLFVDFAKKSVTHVKNSDKFMCAHE